MTYITVIILSALVAIISYIVALVAQYGIPKSISYTDYILKPPFKWVFEGVLTFCGASLIAVSVLLLGSVFNILALAGVLFIGVAVFARYNLSKFYGSAHIACATGGFSAFVLAPWVCFGMIFPTAVAAVAIISTYFILNKHKNRVFWVECMTIFTGFIALILTIT